MRAEVRAHALLGILAAVRGAPDPGGSSMPLIVCAAANPRCKPAFPPGCASGEGRLKAAVSTALPLLRYPAREPVNSAVKTFHFSVYEVQSLPHLVVGGIQCL